jgi:hypothetical protein
VILLAALVSDIGDLFQKLTTSEYPSAFFTSLENLEIPTEVLSFLNKEQLATSRPTLSQFQKDSLVVNFFAPMMVAIGLSKNEPDLIDVAVNMLSKTKAEQNSISRLWKEFGIESRDSAQSQALTELFNEYCSKKRCMECSVGSFILGTPENKKPLK